MRVETSCMAFMLDIVTTPLGVVNISNGPEWHQETAVKVTGAPLQQEGRFPTATELNTIDGVRASNTTPVVVLRFEADNTAALKRIQNEFKAALRTLKPDLLIDF